MIRVLALGALLLGACTVSTRSDQFACDKPADCQDGRICVDHFCVVGGGDIDAPVDPCPAACSSCTATACIFDCTADGACAAVTCPAGWDCEVRCGGDSSCTGAIDCRLADSCAIDCSGPSSCAGMITCGTSRCTVGCSAAGSCGGGIDCASSCACDTDCSGASACDPAPSCHRPAQCFDGTNCHSDGAVNCSQCGP